MRGEDLHHLVLHVEPEGPPPHARGRRRQPGPGLLGPGTTPACAGKTGGRFRMSAPPRDHPRMRGEDCSSARSAAPSGGPPPHARGRLTRRGPTSTCEGTTPACAGKTPATNAATRHTEDHPRMRGEDAAEVVEPLAEGGPPPHARGRRPRHRHRRRQRGTTPACAGKTHADDHHPDGAGDHPRMRGEDALSYVALIGVLGPPPHARGRRAAPRDGLGDAGTTPACAGKTGRPAGGRPP